MDQADRELASFYVNLPQSMQAFSYETADIWVCVLHLSYYYALLLLHRQSPVPGERERTVEDARICSDAVTTITAIFDSLRKRKILGSLWIPSAYVLFATLVHVCSHLQSPNPIVTASSRQLFSRLMDTLQALNAKWLFARSLFLIFKRGLSQDLSVQLAKSNLSDAHPEETTDEGDDSTGANTTQTLPRPFKMSSSNSNNISSIGPRPWWMQDQEQDAPHFMAPPPLNTSLVPGSTTAPMSFMGSGMLPPDGSTNVQLDFELFLAGLGTGDDATHDFFPQM